MNNLFIVENLKNIAKIQIHQKEISLLVKNYSGTAKTHAVTESLVDVLYQNKISLARETGTLELYSSSQRAKLFGVASAIHDAKNSLQICQVMEIFDLAFSEPDKYCSKFIIELSKTPDIRKLDLEVKSLFTGIEAHGEFLVKGSLPILEFEELLANREGVEILSRNNIGGIVEFKITIKGEVELQKIQDMYPSLDIATKNMESLKETTGDLFNKSYKIVKNTARWWMPVAGAGFVGGIVATYAEPISDAVKSSPTLPGSITTGMKDSGKCDLDGFGALSFDSADGVLNLTSYKKGN